MALMIVMILVLVAALVMASGVWVAVVLIAAIARVKRPVAPTKDQVIGKTGP